MNEKPHLSPPGLNRDQGPERRVSRTPLFISILFIVLLAGAGAVLFLLPGGMNKTEATVPPASAPVQQPAAPLSGQEMSAQKTGNGEVETAPRSGDLTAAEEKPVQTPAPDAELQEEQDDLSRVQQESEEQAFKDEMSRFFQAIEANQLVRAKSSLKLLRTSRRDDAQVMQATRIFTEKEESAQIALLRAEAGNLSEAEKWQDALAVYKQILAIVPESLSGVNGQSLAAKRLKLDKILAETISQPSRLQDDTQRTAAIKLLTYAQQVEPKGPIIVSQVNRLEELITFAATPVDILLESDNSTDVTIYHVGRMGRFFSRQIVLKPGTYTIVGTRMGYRDIRRTVEIAPASEITRLSIQCEERI